MTSKVWHDWRIINSGGGGTCEGLGKSSSRKPQKSKAHFWWVKFTFLIPIKFWQAYPSVCLLLQSLIKKASLFNTWWCKLAGKGKYELSDHQSNQMESNNYGVLHIPFLLPPDFDRRWGDCEVCEGGMHLICLIYPNEQISIDNRAVIGSLSPQLPYQIHLIKYTSCFLHTTTIASQRLLTYKLS